MAHRGNGEEEGHRSRCELMSLLLTVERSHVPSNVVAPAHRLDPVYGPSVDPHQVSWPLNKAIHWDVGAVEVFQDWPPGSCQVVYSMPEGKNLSSLFAELF